ncbi:GroES-like protein [Bimuria novae-zelandiae CBS 107.79]|uniref:GroES-like protein n=1 Tax=Bimuria novae-zelandiae CBS 107.79 TaxID=1447943 RepID=A0A6A5USD9_9PLEO|nr:GroES-like protein [Bimuria novae-zelandiae CBS 107.79]
MKAVIIKEHGIAALVDIKEQTMRPDYIKVKTVAVALNPTDYDHCAGVGRVGGILGLDLSGIVEEVGEACKSDVKKGNRVHGVSHGANLSSEEDGAFAEYALVRDGHIAKIPEHMSFEETATLGVGISSLVKSRGADAVYDYHNPECAHLIKQHTKGELYYVLDCVSTESSFKLIAEALPETPNQPVKVVTLLPTGTWPRKDIAATAILAYTSFGKLFTKFGVDFPAVPPHFEFGVMFWKLSQQLLGEGRIKPHPIALRKGGLAGIPYG